VFVLELAGGESFVQRWSVIPADIVAGRHWINILTAMFMHGSWSHIIGNMIFLWAFGPEVEDLMGRPRYAVFYLLGGVAAALAQVAAGPDSTVPNLGASGAIAAVMGAFVVTYPRDSIRSLLVIFVFVRVAYIPAVLLIGVWGLVQFLSLGAVTQQPSSGGGVAYAAHVGGFIFGAVAARLFAHQSRQW
jgi:membrane associated rhomboid family serine protease